MTMKPMGAPHLQARVQELLKGHNAIAVPVHLLQGKRWGSVEMGPITAPSCDSDSLDPVTAPMGDSGSPGASPIVFAGPRGMPSPGRRAPRAPREHSLGARAGCSAPSCCRWTS